MGKCYWVHIGLHKTGTTFLQRYFEAQAQWLQSLGIIFPKTGLVAPDYPTSELAFRGHAGLLPALKGPGGSTSDQLLNKLHQEIQVSGCDTVLLSSEIFSAPDKTEAVASGFKTLIQTDDDFLILPH